VYAIERQRIDGPTSHACAANRCARALDLAPRRGDARSRGTCCADCSATQCRQRGRGSRCAGTRTRVGRHTHTWHGMAWHGGTRVLAGWPLTLDLVVKNPSVPSWQPIHTPDRLARARVDAARPCDGLLPLCPRPPASVLRDVQAGWDLCRGRTSTALKYADVRAPTEHNGLRHQIAKNNGQTTLTAGGNFACPFARAAPLQPRFSCRATDGSGLLMRSRARDRPGLMMDIRTAEPGTRHPLCLAPSPTVSKHAGLQTPSTDVRSHVHMDRSEPVIW
jgi:hypothetical protein